MNFIRQEKSNGLVLKKYKTLGENPEYHSFANYLISLGGNEVKMYSSALPKAIERIISADVERCVEHDKSKAQIRYILSQLYYTQNDYNQGLSYIATFLSCFVHKDVVVNIMRDVLPAKMKRNVWKTSLIHLHEEMHVLEKIFDPGVVKGMARSDIHLQFFLQKYVFTMFINVFEEDLLIDYFKNFLIREDGYHYLVIKSILNQVFASDKYDHCLDDIAVMLEFMGKLHLDVQEKALNDAEYDSINNKFLEDLLVEGRLVAETKIVVISDDLEEDEISIYSTDDSEGEDKDKADGTV